MTKNEICEASVESISSDGSGVARVGGIPVFVPFSAPGDALRIRIVSVKKGYAYGKIEEILSPSGDRMEPGCPYFGKCGGCSFRHMKYESEVKAKSSIVYSAIRRIAGIEPRMLPAIASPVTDYYRNKAEFPVTGPDLGLCMYASRSHRPIRIESCLLTEKPVYDAAEAARKLLAERGVSPYSEETGKGLLRHIYARSAFDSSVMMTLVLNGSGFRDEEGFVRGMLDAVPRISGIFVNTNTDSTNVILGRRFRKLWGENFMVDRIGNLPIRVRPQSFLQVNRSCAALLYDEIGRMAGAGPDSSVLDLFCGAGSIGMYISDKQTRLTGVETVPEAVSDARISAKELGFGNARFLGGDAGELAGKLLSSGKKFDVIVTDPPRKGCSPETLQAICRMSPLKIVMVSCNPATLARDIKSLIESGYQMDYVRPVDMFPRTRHVECVVLMTNVKSK
jgi:23S rRNA (uracil1939-C5)-methyltransferase